MTRRPTGSTVGRLAGFAAATILVVATPAGVGATPPSATPSITVTIDASSRSCDAVQIGYRIEWEGMAPDQAGAPVTIELLATPGDYFLTSETVDFGHKSDKDKGKVSDELVRESGYFDHQTYPGLAYQVAIRTAGLEARSDALTIPDCMSRSSNCLPVSAV